MPEQPALDAFDRRILEVVARDGRISIAALAGRVAVTDIYPGQQLTATYFAYAAPGTLQTKITGTDRAVSSGETSL